jgi:steroid delta-isomerase-like uncharacterized protein
MPAAAELKKLNEQFYDEVFRRRRVEAIDTLLTDDFVEHTPAPGQGTDRRATKEFISQMLKAFPDLDFQIENQIAEGDTVAVTATMTGTHRAEFMGVPATGRRVVVQTMDTGKVRGGRFSDHWGLVDVPSLMTQLGLPSPVQ